MEESMGTSNKVRPDTCHGSDCKRRRQREEILTTPERRRHRIKRRVRCESIFFLKCFFFSEIVDARAKFLFQQLLRQDSA